MRQDDEAQRTAGIHMAAERVMSAALGGPVRLVRDDPDLNGTVRPRSRVMRCSVVEAPETAPATVVVKSVQGSSARSYDPNDLQPGTSAWRWLNEWAGPQFLRRFAFDPPLGPQIFGGDRELGVVVMEDLGKGGSLADLLLGDDAVRAELGLIQFASTLGRLHAATIGQVEEWDRLLVDFGASAADIHRSTSEVSKQMPQKLRSVCNTLGVTTSAAIDQEAAAVLAAVSDPGPFLAFVIGDTCPDHHRYDGNGHPRFFDFEGCGYGHALVDAAVGRMPFPSCWCVNRLPDSMPPRMEAAYRAELVTGCPEAAEDGRFYPALVDACAWWMLALVTTYWPLAEALHENRQWGIATMRQRRLLRLGTFAAAAEEYGYRPALGEVAVGMATRLRALWGPEAEMPSYPAFRAT